MQEQNTRNGSGSLKGTLVYAFGDSIVYGHTHPEISFMRLIEEREGIRLVMMAVNGATIVKGSNDVITQILAAPAEEPDIILLEGYTNDAYSTPENDTKYKPGRKDVLKILGEQKGPGGSGFDPNTFCGGFENVLAAIRKRWPHAKVLYVTIHCSGGRDMNIQKTLRRLSMEMCEKWGVKVLDMFDYVNPEGKRLDTNDPVQMEHYIIDGHGSHPNRFACDEFYVPAVTAALKEMV